MSLQTVRVKVEPECAASDQFPVKEEAEMIYHELELEPISDGESNVLAPGPVISEVMLEFECKPETSLDTAIKSEPTVEGILYSDSQSEELGLDSADDCDSKTGLSVKEEVILGPESVQWQHTADVFNGAGASASSGARGAVRRSCAVRLARYKMLDAMRPGDYCRWTAHDTLGKSDTELCKICNNILSHDQNAKSTKQFCNKCEKKQAAHKKNNSTEDKFTKLNDFMIYKARQAKESLTCEICKSMFSTSQHFKRHKQLHSSNVTLPSPIVIKPLNKPKQHKKPKLRDVNIDTLIVSKTQKQAVVFTCDVCKENFDNLAELRAHKRTHKKSQHWYKCKLCKRTFTRVVDLDAHKIFSHKIVRSRNCEACERHKAAKQLRMLTKSKEKRVEEPYYCKKCDVSY